MNREHVHGCWAPAEGRFSSWVKPVLFSAIDEDVEPGPVLAAPQRVSRDLLEPLATGANRDTALIVDLPSDSGAWLGVWLAGFGFRPIPLYNAVQERFGVIDLSPIVEVLVAGARASRKRQATARPYSCSTHTA